MAIFGKKKKKAIPIAPPVDDEDMEIAEAELETEEANEIIDEEVKSIEKKLAKVEAKRKPPIEEPIEEELTEEKVKQILINFEMRLQKIEYNLRLIP